MAVSITSHTENTVTLFAGVYADLVRESEQLRILKNFIELEEVFSKDQVKVLVKAMEVEQ
jgi:hypothetical protein